MTEEEREKVLEASRYWYLKGEVMMWRDCQRALQNDEMPDKSVLNLTNVKPQTDVDMEEVEIPPRSGIGSGVAKWREFAKEVSEMDPEVIEAMSKDDLIAELETMGIIEAEEESEYEEQ